MGLAREHDLIDAIQLGLYELGKGGRYARPDPLALVQHGLDSVVVALEELLAHHKVRRLGCDLQLQPLHALRLPDQNQDLRVEVDQVLVAVKVLDDQ